MGPYVVIRRNTGGAYEVREANGAKAREKVAAFRLLPYIQRDSHHFQRLLQHSENHDSATDNELANETDSEDDISEA